jgi:CRISPR system Cascade subunit CasE
MKSFLTKIEIDHETAFKAGLRDSYAWHQKIWLAFPNRPDAARNFLTRLDEIEGGFRLLVLSQESPVKPDWCPSLGWNSKPVAESFFQHSAYRFSVVANPTKKVRTNAAGELVKNGRRLPLSKREDLLLWIERKAEQNGFQLTGEVQTIPRPSQLFIKSSKAGRLTATEFRGSLKVTEPAAFSKAALQGIGSAKAFGFGLLCLSAI